MTGRPQDEFRNYLQSQMMRPIRSTGTIAVIDGIQAMGGVAASHDPHISSDIAEMVELLMAAARMPIINNQKNRDIFNNGLAALQILPDIYAQMVADNPQIGHMADAASSVRNSVPLIAAKLTELYGKHYPINQMERGA